MEFSFPVFLLIAMLVASVSMLRRMTGTDKEDEIRLKKLLRRMSMFAGCISSGVVGILFLRFDPQLFSSLLLKKVPQVESLLLVNSIELLFGTTSIPIILDIIFAHALLVLCFMALPMMVCICLVLLYPVFDRVGKAKTTHNKFSKRVVVFIENVNRTFLVFSCLRN